MISLLSKSLSQIHTILILRCAAILIQLGLILFVNLVLELGLPWLPLLAITSAEILFTAVSFVIYRRQKHVTKLALMVQICADVFFLSLLLYFSGGATNAFVSLLLIPIAIAAVTLNAAMLAAVSLSAVLAYSILLWLMPMHVMHGNMEGHFIAMWVNFLFSAGVVAIVVGKMSRSINQRELAIAAYREEQLKQEKVVALGVASAQVAHQLATPIATVQLLADELQEDDPGNEAIADMQTELTRCRDSLDAFRKMVFDIKNQVATPECCGHIIEKIEDNIGLNYPDIDLQIDSEHQESLLEKTRILSDASLLPAILNLVNNGVRATKANGSNRISLHSRFTEQDWQLDIRDYGKGFTLSRLNELGVTPVASEEGLGMAVLLSHASLERLGGHLSLTNHVDGGAIVSLTMPIER